VEAEFEGADAKMKFGSHALSVEYAKEFYSKNDWKVNGELGFTYEYEQGTENKVDVKVATPAFYGVSTFMNFNSNWKFVDEKNINVTGSATSINFAVPAYNLNLGAFTA